MMLRHLFIACAIAMMLAPVSDAAEPATARVGKSSTAKSVVPPIDTRFDTKQPDEVPDFQRHVMPLLGRLGCNGRSCHGSFQGRGGFQLSLFGYDFKGDHEAFLAENTGRVDTDDIEESLILAKPSDADLHEGGKRFDKGKWQYQVIRSWIAAGAKFEEDSLQQLKELEIQPSEIRFRSSDENVSLRAIAHWADGTSEDVTPLCRFRSNDDSIAAIDETGQVQSGDAGDTHVVVFYDNAVVPVPVLRPLPGTRVQPGESVATRLSDHPIDVLVKQKLDKIGITSSEVCTDAEFVRRASLDITGVLPSADRVRDFLADGSADKRERLVEELLSSPAYAAWWATRMSDWTGNSSEQLNNVLPFQRTANKLWYEWMRTRLEDNMPYDEIIEGIVTAQTREDDETYREYCEEMTKACTGETERFTSRSGMPLYWARRNFQKTEDRAIGFAYTFLGVRIECAQCHKHPFDQWSKQDFDEFAKVFGTIRAGNANLVSNDAKKERTQLLESITGGEKLNNGDLRRKIYAAAKDGKVVPFGELVINSKGLNDRQKKQREIAKRKGRKVAPLKIPTGKILGADEELLLDKDPRPALMDWLRSESNPYFAKAIVNRVWSNYFGAGIVDPTDDMNLANPPSNAPLLDHLASEFIRNEYDLKWLHRTIVTSDTYQRSAETNATNVGDRINFSHHLPRRLPAEVVFDMVALATGSTEKASQLRGELTQMAIAEGMARTRNGPSNFALSVFGQSIRESNCDCDRSDAPSLLQSIYLRNDSEMYKRIADRNGWVAEACQAIGVEPPSTSDAKLAGKVRAAESQRRSMINRVKQVLKLPEARRERSIDKLKQQHKAIVKRIGKDFEVPSLDALLESPEAWSELKEIGLVDRVAGQQKGLAEIVEEAYLRTLSRYPDEDETSVAMQFITESEQPSDGIEGLMWALVNTKEFIISH
ncbi:MAG: DUF1549 and DUF1553 domain-containing protein [Planctomycetota bacterium]